MFDQLGDDADRDLGRGIRPDVDPNRRKNGVQALRVPATLGDPPPQNELLALAAQHSDVARRRLNRRFDDDFVVLVAASGRDDVGLVVDGQVGKHLLHAGD